MPAEAGEAIEEAELEEVADAEVGKGAEAGRDLSHVEQVEGRVVGVMSWSWRVELSPFRKFTVPNDSITPPLHHSITPSLPHSHTF